MSVFYVHNWIVFYNNILHRLTVIYCILPLHLLFVVVLLLFFVFNFASIIFEVFYSSYLV